MSFGRHASRLLAFIVLCGCEKPLVPTEQELPAPTLPPPPACQPVPTGDVVAQWTGPDRCPLIVLAVANTLQLRSLGLTSELAAVGTAPECRVASCRYEGVNTELGPMLIATEPAAPSEVPAAVFLGVVAGAQLVFIDLWAGAGPSVQEDSTAVGPAQALAPQRCGAQLGLFAQPRVPGIAPLQIPPALAQREGVMTLDRDGGTLRPGRIPGCRPLDVPLP